MEYMIFSGIVYRVGIVCTNYEMNKRSYHDVTFNSLPLIHECTP